jgi:hypothetical protein
MVDAPVAVYLEVAAKKVFACALDWPGWCRSGRTEEGALAALADYAGRYAAVAARAGVPFPVDAGARFEVVQRLPGGSATEFGVPYEVAAADAEPLTAPAAARQAALVRAAWAVLDHTAARSPPQLRKGPRGGGRDRDKMLDHVLAAEAAYARKIGVRHKPPAVGDTAAITALRDDLVAVLSEPSDGTPLVPKGWPPRYAARRIAWHVLDHAWEMADRREPAG